MEDSKIISLFWVRDEAAITETNKKYGSYCYTIAYRILSSYEDSKECVNDTWYKAWESIPPQKPSKLQYFLSCITRNLALDRYNYNTAKKRNTHLDLAIDEYWECIPNNDAPIEETLALKQLFNSFLADLDKRTRIIFLRRYWYACSVQEIADGMNLTPSYVSLILHRTRARLKAHLEKEGVSL